GIDVPDAGYGELFVVEQSAALGIRNDEFHGGNGQALRDAASLVHLFIFACGEGNLLDNLADVVRNFDITGGPLRPGFLRGDGDGFLDGFGIVGANLAADAVFERSDDLATSGVILGVGTEDDSNVERQTDWVALNLHIAFLHDVEERD